MRRKELHLLGAFLLIPTAIVLSGCNSGSRNQSATGNPGTTTTTTNPPTPNPSGNANGSGGTGAMIGLQSQTVMVSGQAVDYLLYVPPQYDPAQSWPVLFVFHGQGGTNMNTINNWMAIADTNGIVIGATMSSGSSGGWVPGTDSGVFQAALMDAESQVNINTKRRYMWGFSAGGHFVHSLGLANSTFFAAYAVSAGVVQQGYTVTRQIPVSIHIGDQDPLLPGVQQDRTELMNRGHSVSYHEFQGGHTVLPGQRQDAWDDIKGVSLP
jgi:poly(3-hydroxybutyrate) depolymerase